jgi:transposase
MSIKNKFDLSLRIAKLAQKEGISGWQVYETTRDTVRKWLYRYIDQGIEGLKEKSRALKLIPHKISKQEEERIVALRKRLPSWGQDRLKEEFNLPYSTKTINRVLKQNGLIKKRKKRWQKR